MLHFFGLGTDWVLPQGVVAAVVGMAARSSESTFEMTSQMELANTQTELAAALGVDRRQLPRWRLMGCPVPSRGPYDVQEIREWVMNSLQRSPILDDDPEIVSLRYQKLEAEVRLKTAKADLEELKTAKLKGMLVDVEFSIREVTRVILQMKQRMFQIPRAIAEELMNIPSAPETEKIVYDGIWQAFFELSEGKNSQ